MREVFMANKEKITIKLNNLKFDAQNPRLPMRLMLKIMVLQKREKEYFI